MRKEFVDAVVNEIKSIVGDNTEVNAAEVFKNNKILTGITVRMENATVVPTVYLENYEKENDIRKIAREIVEDIADTRINAPQFDTKEITSLDYIKKNVSLRLINYEKNKGMLENIAHIEFLDLAMICCVNVAKDAVYKVSNSMLNHIGITKEALFEIAKENTPNLYKVSGRNILDILGDLKSCNESHVGLDDFSVSELPMYVLTNEQKCFGAVTILYDGVLSTLANQIDSDIVILPSSLHETILIPYDAETDFTYVKEMVSEINGSEVAEDEVLSDNIYLYCRNTGLISILN